MQFIDLQAIVNGHKLFESNGFSDVVVYRDGKASAIRIPITTARVSDVLNELNRNEPQPPSRRERLSDDECKELCVSKGSEKVVFDYTDKRYLDDIFAHRHDYRYRLVVAGLDMSRIGNILDTNGLPIVDPKILVEYLKKSGITNAQMDKIAEDISKLYRQNLEDTDFLSEELSA